MAAPELSQTSARTRRLGGEVARAWVCAYTTLWAATLATAALIALAPATVTAAVRETLALSLTATATGPPVPGRVLTLAAHNIPIAAWPLLLGLLGVGSEPRARRGADILVGACLLANTLPVGAAVGVYGARLLPYVPQLPIEWAALAVGYGGWLVQRRRVMSGGERLLSLALVIVVLVLAAALETYAVPHR